MVSAILILDEFGNLLDFAQLSDESRTEQLRRVEEVLYAAGIPFAQVGSLLDSASALRRIVEQYEAEA